MKRLLLLSIFLLAGCWLNKTVSTRPVDVPKEIPNTNSGNIVSQTWTTETLLQTWQNLSGVQNEKIAKINIKTKIFDKEWLKINLPENFWIAKSEKIETNGKDYCNYLCNITRHSAWWEVHGCKEVVPIIYSFQTSLSWTYINLYVYPQKDIIKNTKLTWDDCVDVIKDRYRQYDWFLWYKWFERAKQDFNQTFQEFWWFTGQILKQNWNNVWIDFYDFNSQATYCYADRFLYRIYFMDKKDRLVEIDYDFSLDWWSYVDKYISNNPKLEKSYIEDILCNGNLGETETQRKAATEVHDKFTSFVIDNIWKYNTTDYANIQSIKKWVLNYLSSK